MNTHANTLRIDTAHRSWHEVDGPLGVIDLLLRDRDAFRDHLEDARDLASIARALLITVVLGCAVFGASMGAYRGGLQLLYAAVKLPLVVLLTAGICGPALSGALAAVRGEHSLVKDLLLVLSALALGSMVLAALAPAVILAVLAGIRYHSLILLIVTCCAGAGLFGLIFFVQGLRRRKGSGLLIATPIALLVFSLVGSQMAWTLRPFVLRPRTKQVPFIRDVEGGFMDAVQRSADSARGVYHRDAAPLPPTGGHDGHR